VTDAAYGFYILDLNLYYPTVGWVAGDTIDVSVTMGSLSGSAQGIAKGPGNDAFMSLNVTLQSSGPTPHDFMVTLTVTDLLGRTASMSQTVTVYW